MRILWAFIITVIIYILLIWGYFLYFKDIKIVAKKKESEHIIKIDIRDIQKYVEKIEPKIVTPKPPKKEAKKQESKKKKLKKIVKKTVPPKKIKPPEKKKVIKKKRVIKKVEAEILAPKKIKIPKKTEIKPPPIFIEKKTVEYTPEIIEVEEVKIAEPIYEEPVFYDESISYEESIEEEAVIEEEYIEYTTPAPTPKPIENIEINDIIAEEDMLYIPNPMITTPSKTENSLSSLLGQSTTDISSPPKSPLIQKLYGRSFDSFTPVQKKFIIDKLGSIHHITQRTLTRRGYPAGAVAMQTGQEGENIVSFDLHPNGDISNLRLESETGYRALDENTLQTIKIAYKDYPYPTETTHIVFYVEYSIFGY